MLWIFKISILVVAFLHLFFLWLEMFAWTSLAPKIFRNFSKDLFPKTKNIAANQGLYNGFLAAGLLWSLFIGDAKWSLHIAIFFLICVLVASLYGAYSISIKILYIQRVPAAISLGISIFLLTDLS